MHHLIRCNEDTDSFLEFLPKNTQFDSIHEETSDKCKLRDNLQNWSTITFKSINTMKVPEKLENCSRLNLTKELWQVNTTLDS